MWRRAGCYNQSGAGDEQAAVKQKPEQTGQRIADESKWRKCQECGRRIHGHIAFPLRQINRTPAAAQKLLFQLGSVICIEATQQATGPGVDGNEVMREPECSLSSHCQKNEG